MWLAYLTEIHQFLIWSTLVYFLLKLLGVRFQYFKKKINIIWYGKLATKFGEHLDLVFQVYSAKLETSLFYSRLSFVCVVATCSMHMYFKPWWCSEYDRVQFTRYARFTYRPVTGTVICTFCTCTQYMSSICWFSSCHSIHAIGAFLKIYFIL